MKTFELILLCLFIVSCKNATQQCDFGQYKKFDIVSNEISILLPTTMYVTDSSIVLEKGPEFYVRNLMSVDSSERAFLTASISEKGENENSLFQRLKSTVGFLKNGQDSLLSQESNVINNWNVVVLKSTIRNNQNHVIGQIACFKKNILVNLFIEISNKDGKLSNEIVDCIISSIEIK